MVYEYRCYRYKKIFFSRSFTTTLHRTKSLLTSLKHPITVYKAGSIVVDFGSPKVLKTKLTKRENHRRFIKALSFIVLKLWQSAVSNQIFHYSFYITPKRITSWRGLFPRHCACEQHNSYQRNVRAVASRWQRRVGFDKLEIWTADLPLQRRTCCRLTKWTIQLQYIESDISAIMRE